MDSLDYGLTFTAICAVVSGIIYISGNLRFRMSGEVWIPIFIIVSSGTDIVNLAYFFFGKNNLFIINFYCLIEPILFYLIWTKGNILKRENLLIFLCIYGIFIILLLYEVRSDRPIILTHSVLWYSLFFSFIFVNLLADTIIKSFSDKNARPDFFFYLGILLYLSFDVVTGLFDSYYMYLSDKFYDTKQIIKSLNMIFVYLLYTYYNTCRILRKTYFWPLGSA